MSLRSLAKVFLVSCCLIDPNVFAEPAWPAWRGQSGQGLFDSQATLPIQWSEGSVAWKAPIAGRGSSTPIITDGAAFLTSGNNGKNELHRVDLESGQVVWSVALGNDTGNKHKKGGGSNPSPVADDGAVYVYFRSGDFGCIELDGKIRWQKNLQSLYGEDTLWWDLGSSPVVTDTAVVITVMQTGPSYLVGFDPQTGEELWKVDRNLDAPEEAAQSYSTPVPIFIDGKDHLAVLGADHLTIHEAANGKMVGRLGGFNPTEHNYFRSIASPVVVGQVVVCPYARGDTVTGVDAKKLIANSSDPTKAILWHREGLGSDVPSPATDGKLAYVLIDKEAPRGTVHAINPKTGRSVWTVRIPKSRIGYSSSPLIAGDHLYVTSENGTTHVIGPLSSSEPKLLHSNELDDDEPFTTASPVPHEGSLLVRTKNNLYRIK
ncbi:MAG: PQQ-binding-like beta-propeller repeat protein [Planctomycetota bacterium]